MTSKFHKERKAKKQKEEKRKLIILNSIRIIMLILVSFILYISYIQFTYTPPDPKTLNYIATCADDGREERFNYSTMFVCGFPNPLHTIKEDKNDNAGFNISLG